MARTGLIRIGCLVTLIGVTIYCAWSWYFQTGLYAHLIVFQARTFELFLPIITGVLMWFVFAVIPMFVIFGGKSKHEYEYSYDELARRLCSRARWLAVATFATAGLSGVAYYLAEVSPAHDQPAIVIDLSAQPDQLLWFKKVSLQGIAITRSATFTQNKVLLGDGSVTRFTPIASTDSRGEVVQFIQATSGDTVMSVTKSATTTEGYVVPKALPVLIRDSLTKDGLVIAKRPYIISNRPFNIRTTLMIVSLILGGVSLILLTTLIVTPFSNRRKLQGIRDHQQSGAMVEWR